MYPVDFPDRLEKSKANTRSVNCISAAHFLLGLIDSEKFIEPERTDPTYMGMRFRKVGSSNINNLYLSDEAVVFGFSSESWEFYWHMGIISPYNRDRLIEREAAAAPITEKPFEQILKGLKNPTGVRIDFFKLNPDWVYPR